MSHGIAGVVVLIENVSVGQRLLEALGHADVALGRVPRGLGRRADDLGAEALQQVDLLGRHLLGQRDDAPVALDGGGQRQANACVAAGRLDERVSGLDAARRLGVLHHAHGNAVLHRAASVEVFQLAHNVALDALLGHDAAGPHERRVANQLEHRVVDLVFGRRVAVGGE